jgi:hypothetical protein
MRGVGDDASRVRASTRWTNDGVERVALLVEEHGAGGARLQVRRRVGGQVRAAGVIDYCRPVSFTRHFSL